jgi:hypothetical protein
MYNKRKATESKTAQKRLKTDNTVRYEKELGDSNFVVVNEYDGQVYVHLRKYNLGHGKKYPTKKGAALTPSRWQQFVSRIVDVENAVQKLSDGEDVQYTQHLGGNWYVSVTKGFPCVDFRKFWLPEGVDQAVPTRKGIALKIVEFKALLGALDDINEHIPELADVVPCSERDDHQNQLGALRCPECNPNDFQNW